MHDALPSADAGTPAPFSATIRTRLLHWIDVLGGGMEATAKALGKSEGWLARALGVPPYLNPRRLSVEEVDALLAHLGLGGDALFGVSVSGFDFYVLHRIAAHAGDGPETRTAAGLAAEIHAAYVAAYPGLDAVQAGGPRVRDDVEAALERLLGEEIIVRVWLQPDDDDAYMLTDDGEGWLPLAEPRLPPLKVAKRRGRPPGKANRPKGLDTISPNTTSP